MISFEIKEHIGGGVECEVYNIGDNIVYKEYADANTARFAFEMQQIAYNNGIGPMVIAVDKNGYYSERVKPLGTGKTTIKWKQLEKSLEYENFRENIFEVFGDYFLDNHNGNIARLSDGKLCLIDFGGFGFQNCPVAINLADEHDIDLIDLIDNIF